MSDIARSAFHSVASVGWQSTGPKDFCSVPCCLGRTVKALCREMDSGVRSLVIYDEDPDACGNHHDESLKSSVPRLHWLIIKTGDLETCVDAMRS